MKAVCKYLNGKSINIEFEHDDLLIKKRSEIMN